MSFDNVFVKKVNGKLRKVKMEVHLKVNTPTLFPYLSRDRICLRGDSYDG